MAPMPGKVIALLARPGAAVDKGAPLLVLEAMKMEHTISAPRAGTVKALPLRRRRSGRRRRRAGRLRVAGRGMQAVVMHALGPASVLAWETLPTPEPAAGEVLVRVRAATVNRTDIFHRSGRFFIQKPLPHVLGMDVAGEVAALGPGVSGWAAGDRVVATFEALGRERDGAYAEYTVVPATRLHRIPDPLSDIDAASIGLAFTTAWTALFTTGGLAQGAGAAAGERVAVHAATSGVGSAALQIARWAGARGVAICDPASAGRIAALGAHAVVDRHAGDLARRVVDALGDGLGAGGATLVLDLVGRSTLQASIDMLAPGGRVVVAGTLSGDRAEIDAMTLMMKRASIRGAFNVIAGADDASHQLRGSSQPKRQIAIAANSGAKPSRTPIGATAASKPRPRQVIASRPSTAQRVGTTSVSRCSHGGKMNDGTQAPPSITIISVARSPGRASPRASCRWPRSAGRRSTVSSAKAIATPTKPAMLPSMRTLEHADRGREDDRQQRSAR